MDEKRQHGQYFTVPTINIFELEPFQQWFSSKNVNVIVEPFAGAGDIPKLLELAGFMIDWHLYDIQPQNSQVIERDTISDFPSGYSIAITNPPYLAKNSASRRGLEFPKTNHDDLYKYCLEIMLANCEYVACIIPESFITQNLYQDRLSCVISLTTEMFSDTECPTCLALFDKESSADFRIFNMNEFVGMFSDLKLKIQQPLKLKSMVFNDPDGEVGLLGVDGTAHSTIQFIHGSEIAPDDIKSTSRAITRIRVDGVKNLDVFLQVANEILTLERTDTHDVFMTAFKGLRKDGKFRRRLDFKSAKRILSVAFEILE